MGLNQIVKSDYKSTQERVLVREIMPGFEKLEATRINLISALTQEDHGSALGYVIQILRETQTIETNILEKWANKFRNGYEIGEVHTDPEYRQDKEIKVFLKSWTRYYAMDGCFVGRLEAILRK